MEDYTNLIYHYKLHYRRNSNILAKAYETIYFNTQKNANSSMKAQFVEVLGLPKTDSFPKDIHYKYDFPSASKDELNTKYQDFLKFSIVRNPWERLFSCYKNKINKSSSTGADFILQCSPDLYLGMPFEEFVDVICEIPDSEADYHFCSQIYMLLYPDGTFPINYLCNFENLDYHLEEIKAKTGIPFATLSRLNSSKKSNYKLAYTPKLIEKVRTRYHLDIQLFKYEFGNSNNSFPFGFLESDFEKELLNSSLMVQILTEKNREIIRELELQNSTMLKKVNQEVNQQNKKIKILEGKYDAIKNSLSWKITAPLRNTFFSKTKKHD